MPDMLEATEVRRLLKEFITVELMNHPGYPLGDDDPLFSGGLIDSFYMANLGVFIEVRFGVYVLDTELTTEDVDTVRRISERVLSARGA